MSIRIRARVAGVAVLVAEATGVATHTGERPRPVIWAVLAAAQVLVLWWATDRRSAARLRAAAPAALTSVTVAAVWTALALAVPVTATGNAAALVAIVMAGFVVAASRPGPGRRPLLVASAGTSPRPLLIASAGTALLIYLMIALVLPGVPGFVGNSDPPTYTDVIRLVDPIGELGIFVLIGVTLGVDVLRARIRARRAAMGERRRDYGAGANEMVVERGT